MAVVIAGLALGACSSGTDGPSGEESPSSAVSADPAREVDPSATASAAASAEPATPTAELVAETSVGRVSCVRKDDSFISLLQPTLRAVNGSVTLVDVRPEASPGVRIQDSEVVLLRRGYDVDFGVGVTLGDTWPIAFDDDDRRSVVVRSRASLDGFVVPDGRYVAPLLKITTGRAADIFTAISVRYVAADGATRSVRVPIGTRFSEEPC